MSKMNSVSLAASEGRVMKEIWKADGAVKPMEVLAALRSETGWQLSTVRTLLKRLTAKGVLKEEMKGGTNYYSPLFRENEIGVAEGASLLKKYFDGTLCGLMSGFIETGNVSARELREIRELIDREIAQSRSGDSASGT